MTTHDRVVSTVLAACALPVAAVFVAGLWGHASAALFVRTAITAALVFGVALFAAGVRWPRRDR